MPLARRNLIGLTLFGGAAHPGYVFKTLAAVINCNNMAGTLKARGVLMVAA